MVRRICLFVTWLWATQAFCQLPSSRCDSMHISVLDCAFTTSHQTTSGTPVTSEQVSVTPAQSVTSSSLSSDHAPIAVISSQEQTRKEGFHWGRALFESFMFLSIEQAYVVHTDYYWVTYERGIPFNHYWRDYKQSLHSWIDSGWSDGDPNYYGYLGHPIQGALTSFIQIQNDPKGRDLEFSNTKAYWRSRLKATLWNAVYSTQWNIGPLSEMTVEKYGAKVRSPWNQNGTWPCTSKNCYDGVGQIDLVMTPVGGMAWMLGEDLLDRAVARRLEGATQNRFLIDFTRCAVNPIRGGANILHGKMPWYRASRDKKERLLPALRIGVQ